MVGLSPGLRQKGAPRRPSALERQHGCACSTFATCTSASARGQCCPNRPGTPSPCWCDRERTLRSPSTAPLVRLKGEKADDQLRIDDGPRDHLVADRCSRSRACCGVRGASSSRSVRQSCRPPRDDTEHDPADAPRDRHEPFNAHRAPFQVEEKPPADFGSSGRRR